MTLLIDLNDGAGMVEYTQAVRSDAPLTITRARGAWSVCQAGLDLVGSGLTLPPNRSHVRVTDAAGTVMFEGFSEADAMPSEAAAGSSGAVDCVMLRASERAWLTQAFPNHELQPATSANHAVALSDVRLHVETVMSPDADLATDVTVCGEKEAAEYVTELFRGDGTTQTFALQHVPFREHGSGTLLNDAFDGIVLNAAVWTRADPGDYITLGSGGLRMHGGTGFDGATVLRRTDPVELGGSLVAEVSGVRLDAGSDGVLLGFYDGLVAHAQCIAGVRILGSSGAHSLVALVHGVEQAVSYDVAPGHSYTLRIRLHCPEMQRIRNRYTVLVDGVLRQFGGDAVDAPMRVVIDVVDAGLASNTLPTVLYDGAMANSPLQAVFAPVNSVALSGSVARVVLAQTGSCLVTTVAADGSVKTQRQGEDYTLTSTGTMTFAPGLVPQPGELITVQYRRARRAVARRVDESAAYLQASMGLPGVPSWSGRVLTPAARSAADCDAAAKALLALAAGSATGVTGTATWTRGGATGEDVLPADTVLVNSAEGTQILPVTAVNIVDGNCEPERAAYRVVFRQSRAASMDFRVESGVASDAALPIAIADDVTLPPSLQGLQVTAATTTALQVDAGTDAPGGGGFEVRRSNANFGSADTTDLILRSPVRSFSFPRAAFAERFFVRMYDSAVPPNYSAVSSVVVTNLPVS